MFQFLASMLAPPERLRLSEWTAKYRMLPQESSAEPGEWDLTRAYYQVGIMEAMTDPSIEQVWCMKSAQIGWTEIVLNFILWMIDQDPGPALMVQPTVEMGRDFSKDRLAPSIRDCTKVLGIMDDPFAKRGDQTLLHKVFTGGHLTIVGANSPAGMSSRPIRYVQGEEPDRWPQSAGSEGDPFGLAIKRTTTFPNRKIVIGGTPTITGRSLIERGFLETDQRHFFVPCHDCRKVQVLVWGGKEVPYGVKWDGRKASTARYVCRHCLAPWNDAERWGSVPLGDWTPTAQGKPGRAGFHVWEAYSPWVSLERMVDDFLEKVRLPDTHKVFVNTSEGRSWQLTYDTELEPEPLMNRREAYAADPVPSGVVALTAAVDCQADRLEMEVAGWGRDQERWSIDTFVLMGDPTGQEVWKALETHRTKIYQHPNGFRLRIAITCVDSGAFTESVYQYCKPRFKQGVLAVKGQGGTGKPLISKPSRNNLAKVNLFVVGTDTAKELLFGRLAISKPGPGFYHFPLREPYNEDWFAQLTSEVDDNGAFRKRNKGDANEKLDLVVYNIAAFAALNIDVNALADQMEQGKVPGASAAKRRSVRSQGIRTRRR